MQVREIRPNSRCCKLQGTVEGYQATTGKALAPVYRRAVVCCESPAGVWRRWPGSTCPRLFSLREGTLARASASNFLTHATKVEHVMPWTHITAAAAAISFWLTLAMAATGSLLSALCILAPVSEPKRNPYFFIGQWLIWLATPLLWGAVAASAASEWLKPFDLLLVMVLAVGCRWAAQAVCNLKWRGKSPSRVPGVV